LLSHNSDLIVGNNTNILNNKFLIKWLGTNMIPTINTLGIPIGLENTHWKRTNFHCLENYKNNNEKSNLLYFNFNIATNPTERTNIKNIFINKNFKWTDNKKWDEYIYLLSQSKYCVSPEGNGFDCHRIWEAIYVNCIPIVKNNVILKHHFEDLPILWVDDYNLITESYLINNFDNFKIKNIEKSKMTHWKTIIDNLINH
jgi:hypothetical protein